MSGVVRLDVRPILASGRDPFGEVMAAAEKVPEGGSLIVLALFNPVPLRDVLGSKGFSSHAAQTEAGVWEVEFSRLANPTAARAEREPPVRYWADSLETHIDTRGLDEPAAIEAVISAIGGSGEFGRLVAHLDADLDLLYAALAQLGWEAALIPGDPGEVRLEITRAA